MSYTYEELKTKTIAELREIAKDVQHDAVQGYSQMNKDHLLPSLCRALGVDMRGHHEVVGIDKAGIKAKIRELKRQRDELLQAGDRSQLKTVRRHMHHLNHQLRAHMRYTCDVQRATCNVRRATCDVRRATCGCKVQRRVQPAPT
jgi:hypothetical protein